VAHLPIGLADEKPRVKLVLRGVEVVGIAR
jgi:hypothetical protein